MTQDSDYRLHERLAADTILLGHWPLCELRLMNDSQYPWVILVPRRPDVREIYELSAPDQQHLLQEINVMGQGLMQLFAGDKLNVAALGNLVPQLHLHLLVRFTADAAWPAPVWGRNPAVAYEADALAARLAALSPLVAALRQRR